MNITANCSQCLLFMCRFLQNLHSLSLGDAQDIMANLDHCLRKQNFGYIIQQLQWNKKTWKSNSNGNPGRRRNQIPLLPVSLFTWKGLKSVRIKCYCVQHYNTLHVHYKIMFVLRLNVLFCEKLLPFSFQFIKNVNKLAASGAVEKW